MSIPMEMRRMDDGSYGYFDTLAAVQEAVDDNFLVPTPTRRIGSQTSRVGSAKFAYLATLDFNGNQILLWVNETARLGFTFGYKGGGPKTGLIAYACLVRPLGADSTTRIFTTADPKTASSPTDQLILRFAPVGKVTHTINGKERTFRGADVILATTLLVQVDFFPPQQEYPLPRVKGKLKVDSLAASIVEQIRYAKFLTPEPSDELKAFRNWDRLFPPRRSTLSLSRLFSKGENYFAPDVVENMREVLRSLSPLVKTH